LRINNYLNGLQYNVSQTKRTTKNQQPKGSDSIEISDGIRQATQKGWALGNDRFKDEIEQLLDRRTRPLPKGGDRRSVFYREGED